MSSLTSVIHPLVFQHRQVGTAVYEVDEHGRETLQSYEITDDEVAVLLAHYLVVDPRRAAG